MALRSDKFTVQRDSLQFDLHGLHVEPVRKRCNAALVAALEQQTFGPTLGRLVATLTAQTRENPMRWYPSMTALRNDMPLDVVDPLSG